MRFATLTLLYMRCCRDFRLMLDMIDYRQALIIYMLVIYIICSIFDDCHLFHYFDAIPAATAKALTFIVGQAHFIFLLGIFDYLQYSKSWHFIT